MSEVVEHTLAAYLGVQFQEKLMWQLLVEPDFAEKALPELAVEYFDDPNLKRLFIIMMEYFNEFGKVPNLQNLSIHQAINKFKKANNMVENESLFAIIKRIELWNQMIINQQMVYDGDAVQKDANSFIKQQEFRKIGEYIIEKTKTGEMKNNYTISYIEERFLKAQNIGKEVDDCEEVIDHPEKALRLEFRQTIATGIEVIDSLTGGGLGKGEGGIILTPSGVGKTTLLTKIANTAYEDEKYVAQIIFEDTKDQVKRKHYTIWSGIALSKLDDDLDLALERVNKKIDKVRGKGKLVIKKFSDENTTILEVRNWMISYQKKYGIKFDILVLDYLDCLESHKKSPDRNESELAIIKGFLTLASDFDIPCWSAIQSNRSGFDAEFVEAHQTGGSIKRLQKSHFFMSVAKTPDQKEAQLANIRILKARFATDGQTFPDCIFNNDTMEIRIEDDRYKYSKLNKELKHHDEKDIEKLESSLNKMHVAASQYDEQSLINKANSFTVGDALTANDVITNNMLNMYKEQNGIKNNIDFDKQVTWKSIDAVEAINAMLIEEIDKSVKEECVSVSHEIDAQEELNKTVKEESSEINNEKQALAKVGGVKPLYLAMEEYKSRPIDEEFAPRIAIASRYSTAKLNENNYSDEKIDIDSIENSLIDPDDVELEHKSLHEMLVQKRLNQNVINK